MIDRIFDFFNTINQVVDYCTPRISLETFMEAVSDRVDEIILDKCKDGDNFLGGKTFFSLSGDNDYILIKVEIFFQGQSGDFRKFEKRGRYPYSLLKNNAASELLEYIGNKGEFFVEIYDPRRTSWK